MFTAQAMLLADSASSANATTNNRIVRRIGRL